MIRGVALLLFACACAAVPEVTYVDGGDNTCGSQLVPSYADICCGDIPCKGTNCPAACNDCASSCTATELCCPTTQGHNVVCRPSLDCP